MTSLFTSPQTAVICLPAPLLLLLLLLLLRRR